MTIIVISSLIQELNNSYLLKTFVKLMRIGLSLLIPVLQEIYH